MANLWRIIIASIKARTKPPSFVFPFDVTSSESKVKALETAKEILKDSEYQQKYPYFTKIAKWWIFYWGVEANLIEVS